MMVAFRTALPMDLTAIKGVGPATVTKLRDAGITSFADLAPRPILTNWARRLSASQPISADTSQELDRSGPGTSRLSDLAAAVLKAQP